MRLFVAIPLPDDIRAGLARLAGGVPGAKWVAAENMHLTLRFIGEVDGGGVADIAAALGRLGGAGLRLQLQGVGQFGDRRRARVLWAGMERSEPLLRLQARIETTLQGSGLEPERRKFHPHITLARLKGAPMARVTRYLTEHGGYRSRPFTADAFALIESRRGGDGAAYRTVVEFPLSAPAAAQ